MIALALAILIGQPGSMVPFRSVCMSPDPLAQMSSVQQAQGMAAGVSIWRDAVADGTCVELPISVAGVLGDKLGSWHGTHQDRTYRWSLWTVDFKGVTLFGLFPDDEDGPSA